MFGNDLLVGSQTAVRAVLFDAVGTLIYPNPPVALVYRDYGRRFGSMLSEDEIATRFRHAFDQSRSANLPTSHAREFACWRKIVADVFCDVAHDIDSLFEQLWQHFAQPEHWRVFDDVAPIWSTLREREFVIGIASNFDDRIRNILAALLPLSDCRHVFYSAEIGFAKPNPSFYSTVQQRLSLPPAEILIVGDDRENDFDAPRRAGWQALHLRREYDRSDGTIIRSLHELAGHP